VDFEEEGAIFIGDTYKIFFVLDTRILDVRKEYRVEDYLLVLRLLDN
jgi:hypothetical protein